MAGQDLLGDRKAKTSTVRSSRYHRGKDIIHYRGRNPWAVVSDHRLQHMAVTTIPQRELPADAGDQRDPSHAFNSLDSVPENVQNGQHQLLAVSRHVWQAGVIITVERQSLLDFGEGEFSDMFRYGMQVKSAFGQGSERPRHPIDQSAQPVRLMDDDSGVFLEVAAWKLGLQQLRCAAQTPQGILDFVAKAADQGIRCTVTIVLLCLLREARQLVDLR